MIQVMLLTLKTERRASLGFELGIYLCFLFFYLVFFEIIIRLFLLYSFNCCLALD